MSQKCNLIKDILPLYVEDMASADTREFVEEHLEHCEKCRGELERMGKPADIIPHADIVPLKRIRQELLRKRLRTILFTAALACAIAAILFGILTSPEYFPYSEGLLHVMDGPDGSILITFDDKVTGYRCTEEYDKETETEVYRIHAWTTTWDAYTSSRGKQHTVIPSGTTAKIHIYYAQNNFAEDVLIYGTSEDTEESITLPRLVLLPYFLLALVTFAVLAMIRFLLRNQQTARVWLDRIAGLPLSYLAAQLCTKGINFTTYSSQRDFCIIILTAILLYAAMLTGKSLYKAKTGAA